MCIWPQKHNALYNSISSFYSLYNLDFLTLISKCILINSKVIISYLVLVIKPVVPDTRYQNRYHWVPVPKFLYPEPEPVTTGSSFLEPKSVPIQPVPVLEPPVQGTGPGTHCFCSSLDVTVKYKQLIC